MRTSKLVGPLAIGLFALACGGATDATSLFGAPVSSADAGHTGSSGGGSGGGSGSGSGSGGNGNGSSSGSSSGGNGSSGGGSGGSSSGGSGSGSSSGSSSGGSSSGGGSDDAGSDPGIYCGKSSAIGGNTYCPVGPDVCCASGSNPKTLTFKCESASNPSCTNSGGLAIQCDNEAECSGQLCCGSLDTNSDTYVSLQCQATCDPLQNQYIFCDPNAATDICATVPANGGPAYTCQVSTALPGFYRCSNQ